MRRRVNSASSLKTLDQCELKYFKRYEEAAPKMIGQEKYLPFGTSVHAGLECLYNMHQQRQEENYKFNSKDYSHVKEHFLDEAAKTGLTDLTLLEEGWNILKQRMDIFDYSEKVLAIEHGFRLVTANGTKFAGHIDKVVILDETTIAVVDYKTSRFALTQPEADKDIQMSMYDLAASIEWPQYKTVIVALDYLRLKPVMSYRTPEQRELFTGWLEKADDYIASLETEDVSPTLNTFCGSCEYKEQCSLYNKALSCFQEESLDVLNIKDDDLVERWSLLRNTSKIVDQATRELKMRLERRLVSSDSRDIIGRAQKVFRTQSSRVSYDIQDLKKVIPAEDLVNICTVNKSALNKYLSKHPEVYQKIKNFATVSYNSPSFRVSKK